MKRIFDILLSTALLLSLGWLILVFSILSAMDTNQNGFFKQERVGQYGKSFFIYKLRSMKDLANGFQKVTSFGDFLRSTKLDEWPQLFNVLIGDMSFVGPRPDILGFTDRLEGEDRIILTAKPGITGPATLVFRNEERILSLQKNPEDYNRNYIWPKKIEINKAYIKNYSFFGDIEIIFKTIFGLWVIR